MHRLLALGLVSVGGVMAQDFSWIPNQLSNVISYEKMHFQECTSFAQDICRPTAASCATALCANCPKYYNTCCLQSTVAPENCFQSIVAAQGGAGQGGAGAAPASATAMPTGSGSGSGNNGSGSNQGASATAGSGAGSSAPAAMATHAGAGVRQTMKAEVLLPVAMAAMFIL